MTRQRAWERYFATGDVEPLVRSYRDKVEFLAWHHYPRSKQDMAQWGMIGLLKGIHTLDVKRVKNIDAWIKLNVKSMMFNYDREACTEYALSLDQPIFDGKTLEDTLGMEDDLDTRIDLLDTLRASQGIDEARSRLFEGGYAPTVKTDFSDFIKKYEYGEISLRFLAREAGISRRQACKMVGEVYA